MRIIVLTRFLFDKLGRQIKVSMPDPDDGGSQRMLSLHTTYDQAGNVKTTYRTALLAPINVEANGAPLQNQLNPADVDADGDFDGEDMQFVVDYLNELAAGNNPAPLAYLDVNGSGTVSPIDLGLLVNYQATGAAKSPYHITVREYDDLNRLISITQPDPDDQGPLSTQTTSYTYDAAGQMTTVTDPLGRVTSYSYDQLGRQVGVANPDPDGSGPFLATIVGYSYDAAGNLLETRDGFRVPWQNANSGDVNNNGFITAQDILLLVTWMNTYGTGELPISGIGLTNFPDVNGDGLLTAADVEPVIAAINAGQKFISEGHPTKYEYDGLGRLIAVIHKPDPDGEGPLLAPTTHYTYDMVGNRKTLTDPEGNTTTWNYDHLNRVIEEINELEDTRFFQYDAVGNLNVKIDRNDRYTKYDYDHLHRLMEEQWLDPTDDETVIHTINWVYDAASQLKEVSDAFAEYAYLYDLAGRVTTITATIAGLTPVVTLNQSYSAEGNRTELTATIGSTQDFNTLYNYDGLDRLTRITQQAQLGGNTVANKRIDFAYRDDGQFDTISRYADLGGSQLVSASTYDYDTTGRLTGLTHAKGATTLADYAWTWDSANRIMSMTNSLWSAEDVTYDYDRLGQLISADRDGSSFDEEYGYDENGNRTNNGFEAGANNRLETDGTYVYGYDAEGNVVLRTKISDGSYTVYQWDHRNRLVSVTDFDDEEEQIQQVSYAYDAGNRLVSRTLVVGEEDPVTGYFIYDGNQMTLAMDDEGNVEHRLLWGPAVDQILADENGEGDVYWMLTDHQNTVRDIVEYDAGEDETNVVNHIAYDSFGNKLSEADDTVETLELNYTGRYFDEATGLQWNLNRWYNPETGRWMSEDPIGFDGQDSNLNRYVSNNPPVFIDSLGLMEAKFVGDGVQTSGVYPDLTIWAGAGIYADQKELAAGTKAGGALLIYQRTDSWKIKAPTFQGSGKSKAWLIDRISFENGSPVQDASVFNGAGGPTEMADGTIAIGYSELMGTSIEKYIKAAIEQTNTANGNNDIGITSGNIESCVSGQLITEISAKYYTGKFKPFPLMLGTPRQGLFHSTVEFGHKPSNGAPPDEWRAAPFSELYFYVMVNFQADETLEKWDITVRSDIGAGPQRDGRGTYPGSTTWPPNNDL